MRHDPNDGVFIAFDFEVKSPAPIHASLPEIAGSLQFFGPQWRMPLILKKELQLFPECFADGRRKRGVILVRSFREANIHRSERHRRFASFFARASSATIASLAVLYGPWVLPFFKSSR